MKVESKLKELGIELPEASAPAAMYVPVKQAGNLLFVSGQTPKMNGALSHTGKVGKERDVAYGQEAAKACAIGVLAALKSHLGDLDKVKNMVKITVFVNSEPDFHEQHIVANGASNLFVEAFGECGQHSRSAVGMGQLPMNCTVEVEAIVEI